MRDECLALLGRFEEGLIRRKVQKLDLTVLDRLLKTLIVHHNFFGRSAIRQLEVLELRIVGILFLRTYRHLPFHNKLVLFARFPAIPERVVRTVLAAGDLRAE